MKLKFTGKNIEVTEALKEVTLKKFEKLNKFFNDKIEGKATFSVVKNSRIFEATIYLHNTIIRAEESTNDMYTSIDLVLDHLERQIRKNKTKLEKRYQSNETIRFETISENNEEEDIAKIVKVKNFDIRTMTDDEAVLQMELLNHDFFVYKDSENGKTNILYKRKDGNYGLIKVD